jgi:hypothetical protein
MPPNALEKKSNFEILEYDQYFSFHIIFYSILFHIYSSLKGTVEV